MNKGVLKRLSLLMGLGLIMVAFSFENSVAQTDAKSTFSMGKMKTKKNVIPGEGSLIGKIVILGKKTKVPLAFIEIEGGKSIQADSKGRFKLTVEQGIHNIKIACSGYKELVIKEMAIQEGTDHYIKIELATTDTGKFK